MTETTKAIGVDRRQRTWWWWLRDLGPGVERTSVHGERPAPEVGEVLAHQVQVLHQLVDIALAVAPVAPTQFVHDDHDSGRPHQNRSDAGEDRCEIHSLHRMMNRMTMIAAIIAPKMTYM